MFRSSHPEVFLVKGILKICSKFTGEHLCRSAISIKLLCNFIEIALRHGCSTVNLLHIFRTRSLKNTSGWLLLNVTEVYLEPYQASKKETSVKISSDQQPFILHICYGCDYNSAVITDTNNYWSNGIHCVKNVRIRSYSGPHFSDFGLNTDRYTVLLCIQSEYRRIQTRITPNTDASFTVIGLVQALGIGFAVVSLVYVEPLPQHTKS